MRRIASHEDVPDEPAVRAARERLRKAQQATERARMSYFAATRETLGERQRAFDKAVNDEADAILASDRVERVGRAGRKHGESRRQPSPSQEDGSEA